MNPVVCPNPDCPEHDVPKTVEFDPPPEAVIVCGACGTPTVPG
jgi:hypothetical protein